MMGNNNSSTGKQDYNWQTAAAAAASAYPSSGQVPQAYPPNVGYPQAYMNQMGQPVYHQHYAGNAYPGYEPPPPYSEKAYAHPMHAQYGYAPVPQTTYVVPNAFDAGARFSANCPASIPPPPPGCVPTAAQIAAAQGQNVVLGQKKSDFFSGGSGGGYTFW